MGIFSDRLDGLLSTGGGSGVGLWNIDSRLRKLYGRGLSIQRTGLKHEPLHGGMNYRLIEALLLANDCIAAAKYSDIYRRRLKNELGLEPDAMFKKLMR